MSPFDRGSLEEVIPLSRESPSQVPRFQYPTLPLSILHAVEGSFLSVAGGLLLSDPLTAWITCQSTLVVLLQDWVKGWLGLPGVGHLRGWIGRLGGSSYHCCPLAGFLRAVACFSWWDQQLFPTLTGLFVCCCPCCGCLCPWLQLWWSRWLVHRVESCR